MEFKGTKGPWMLGSDCNIISPVVVERIKQYNNEDLANEDGSIAQCWEDFYDDLIIPRKESEYNALLISKAPEMLEMLIKISNFLKSQLDKTNGTINCYNDCITLIKEATEFNYENN